MKIRKVPFLGHIVSEEGVSTDPAKIDKVANWPSPTSRHQLQQFLGLASYYRQFVKILQQFVNHFTN